MSEGDKHLHHTVLKNDLAKQQFGRSELIKLGTLQGHQLAPLKKYGFKPVLQVHTLKCLSTFS